MATRRFAPAPTASRSKTGTLRKGTYTPGEDSAELTAGLFPADGVRCPLWFERPQASAKTARRRRSRTVIPADCGRHPWRHPGIVPCIAYPSEPDDRPAAHESDALAASEDSPGTLPPQRDGHERPQGMLPGRERRRTVVERGFVRIVATGGVVGIATILGAVLVSQDVAGWIVGLAVGLTSVTLAAVLWSSRQL
jgi:hypothetical protein